jgi:hypothetical protein
MLPNQQYKTPSYISIFLIALGIYTIAPFLLLNIYNHPSADDFSFAVRDIQQDYFSVMRQYYNSWTGRYFSTITLFRINPMIYGSLSGYKVLSFVLMILLTGNIFLCLHTAFKQRLSNTRLLALVSLLLCLYLLLIPSPAEGFYFFATYATYQFPNILILLTLALLYHFFQTENSSVKIVSIGITALLCIGMIGSNEMSLILTFTTLLLIVIANWNNPIYRPYLIFLFTVCVISCLVAILAPGNYARMSEHPNASRFLWSVVYSAFLTMLTFYRWLVPILAASIIYVFYFGFPLADKNKQSRLFNIDLRFATSYFLGTIFLMYFAFAWSTGERATPRVENVICFFFVFGWFYLLQVALHTYAHLLQHERLLSRVVPAVASLILVLNTLSIDNNISTAYIDLLSGKATAYDEALNQRYALLTASDCDECEVEPLPAIPKTIYFSDILEGPQNNDMWINKGFADYWQKAAVHLSEPNPPIKDNFTTLRESGKNSLRDKSLMH